MAARDEHHPDYNKLPARLKRAGRAFNNSAPGMYLKNTLKFWDEKDSDPGSTGRKTAGFAFTLIGGGFMVGPAFMDDQYEVTKRLLPEADVAATFDADLSGNGHIAFSHDNGETGYALIRYGDEYRLYSFEQQRQNIALTYVHDDDEAWHQARIMADQHRNLRDAAGNIPEELTAQNWEVFQVNELSEFIAEEDGDIIRYGLSIQEFEGDLATSRDEHYGLLANIWSDAAENFANGYEGITQAEIHIRAGDFRTDVELRDNEMKDFFHLMGLILLVPGAALSISGAAVQTHSQVKRRNAEREWKERRKRGQNQNKYI